MVHFGNKGDARLSRQGWRNFAGAAVLAYGLYGCSCSDSQAPAPGLTPAGGLVQKTLRGPISYTTGKGWRIDIQDGALTVKPPEGPGTAGLQYVSQGTRERLGRAEPRQWAGDRRSLLLPGGAKVTLHGQGGKLLRLSLYDSAESHEIDVLTQTILQSKVDGPLARDRDKAEHDGEGGYLHFFQGFSTTPGGLYLGNLYQEDAGVNGTPMPKEPSLMPLARQSGDSAYAFSDPGPTYPAQVEAACDETPQPRGGLARKADSSLEYVSRSGRWTVTINQHTVTAIRKSGTAFQWKWEVWGDPHENLNGKHIKDWEGARRTLLLDDGTKITLHAEGPQRVVHTTSIYDGAQSHEIGNVGNQVRHSCVHAQTSAQREEKELDGEAAHLVILRSPVSAAGSLFTENVYTETEGPDGAGHHRTWSPTLLGETGEADINFNQVRDYYDDPRLGHT